MSKIAVDRQILEQALKALENSSPDQYPEDAGVFYNAKDALRAALEQSEPCKRHNPCERLPDGYCARCHSEMYP